MYKYILILTLVATMLLTVVGLASAADTSTVSATVTAQNVSVSVSDGSVAYGTLAASGSRSTTTADLNDLQTATNNGNVTSQINIRGTNSGSWTLAGTAGTDQYVHRFCTSSCTTPPTNYNPLTTNYQTLAASVAPSGTQTFDLQITVPSTSTVYTSQSVDVIVQAVAL